MTDLRLYHAMLDAYARGDDTKSVEALLEWNEERLSRVLALLNRPKVDPFAPWDFQRTSRAAMLHMDAALRLDPQGATRASLRHLEVVTAMLGFFTHAARGDTQGLGAFADRWFVTMTRYLRSRNSPYVAGRVLQLARERLPQSAAVLYESGTLAEMFATDYALVDEPTPSSPAHSYRFPLANVLQRRTAHLGEAAVWLRKAVAIDAANSMAKVHLGRVLMLLARDDEAAQMLENVRHTAGDDEVSAYLAALFTAGLRERQGNLQSAAAAYREAVARLPVGHAAYIGLSEVLQRAGNVDEARMIVQHVAKEAAGPVQDPLWWYQIDPPGAAERRLEELRKEVRR
jgi:tetratricopeptide (TPR) repeat protein